MKTALVFGASGQIGLPLLDRLGDAGWRVHAVSRQARSDTPGRHWLQGDFAHVPVLLRDVDAIFSCGPLDLFARWYAASDIAAPRVVGITHSDQGGWQTRQMVSRELVAMGLPPTAMDTDARSRAHMATLVKALIYGIDPFNNAEE